MTEEVGHLSETRSSSGTSGITEISDIEDECLTKDKSDNDQSINKGSSDEISSKDGDAKSLNFIRGEGVAKGVRHMVLRLWYVRDEYLMNHVASERMSGKIIPADKLTKLGCLEEHRFFTSDVMGLALIDYEWG